MTISSFKNKVDDKKHALTKRLRWERIATACRYNLWITMQKVMERNGTEWANLLDIHGDEYNAR